jgi:hypothetical protein
VNAVIAWLLTFMVAVAPVDRKQYYPDAMETKEDAEARYNSIASDITAVVWSTENPPLFAGDDGRAKTAAVVMSIMTHESGFRRDVDYGLGRAGRGDSGNSWCLMQVKTGNGRTATWNRVKHRFAMWNDPPDELVQGWTGPELVADRKKCITAGYRIMSASFSACRGLPVSGWLRVYASGSCEAGAPESEHRMNMGINWFNNHRPPFTDAEIASLPVVEPTQLAFSGRD